MTDNLTKTLIQYIKYCTIHNKTPNIKVFVAKHRMEAVLKAVIVHVYDLEGLSCDIDYTYKTYESAVAALKYKTGIRLEIFQRPNLDEAYPFADLDTVGQTKVYFDYSPDL